MTAFLVDSNSKQHKETHHTQHFHFWGEIMTVFLTLSYESQFGDFGSFETLKSTLETKLQHLWYHQKAQTIGYIRNKIILQNSCTTRLRKCSKFTGVIKSTKIDQIEKRPSSKKLCFIGKSSADYPQWISEEKSHFLLKVCSSSPWSE